MVFQFETLFCHVTTNEILHVNCVFSLVYATSHSFVEMNQKKDKLLFYKMWMGICVHCNVFETFCMQTLAKLI